MERMIDISSSPARLYVRLEQLVIDCHEGGENTVPLDEIGAVIVSHRQVTFTHAVLSALAANGAIFIVCDEKHLPAAMLLPLQTHHAQREVFALQAEMTAPLRKRLWKQVVQAKVSAQAKLLAKVTGSDGGLLAMVQQVKSGDSTNVEGQAARRYWSRLFGRRFRRDPELMDQNRHLNYGYAIVRGIVARGIGAAGLHPSLSLHHHNRYDPFALADDLMEPFRPIVDWAVCRWAQRHPADGEFTSEDRRFLLESLSQSYRWQKDEMRTLFDIAARIAASLVKVIRGQAKKLQLPMHWTFELSES